MYISYIIAKKTLIRSRHYTSYKVFSYRQSASKLLRLSYPSESISSSAAQMAPSPAPPEQCCVVLFSTSLVDSGTTLIRVGEEGVSRKRTFWTSFLCNQGMWRCQCALLATVSTNFVADCRCRERSQILSHVFFGVFREIKMRSDWLRCILVILLNIAKVFAESVT